jgi:hypothetical protein
MKTLKESLKEMKEFYERHSEYERTRANQATKGSGIQNELMMASKYNEGRAKGVEEALSIMMDYFG